MPDATSHAPTVGYRWREISDLPPNLEDFRDQELESLQNVWVKEREAIGEEDRIREFNKQLAREWAIETGIIENVYTLDRGITQTLIERGIDASYIPHEATNRDPELVARIIRTHMDALEGLFAFVKKERSLSASYIKELHAALLSDIETTVVFDQFGKPFDARLETGAYKRYPNNPSRPDGSLHEYCPPEHVASEMDRLIDLHRQHESGNVRPYIEAAWLHHAFTQIHPFQDGNGRVARALASVVLIKARLFPLVVTRDERTNYIGALERADAEDLSPLVALFAKLQKRAITSALTRAAESKPVRTVEEAVAATRDLLLNLGRIIPKDYLRAQATASILANTARERMNALAEVLTRDIGSANAGFGFQVGGASAPPTDIAAVGKSLKYDPNLNVFQTGLVLTLNAPAGATSIWISFHGIGATFQGVIAAVAFIKPRAGEPIILSEDPFWITYEQKTEDAMERFKPWLESVLVRGLNEWRRTLV